MAAIAASFCSLVWNTMEWNWVGDRYKCYEALLIRIKLLPLYGLSTLYKCISISVIVGYLRWYSVPLFCLIIIALTLLDFIIRRNYMRSFKLRAAIYDQDQSKKVNAKFIHKYQCKLLV